MTAVSSQTLLVGILAIATSISAGAHDYSGARPDGHAPFSIMADHTHGANEWMVSYRYMRMEMDGMRAGSSEIDTADVFAANYTVTPENMTMEMHMFGVMYAPSDHWTFAGMISQQSLEMDHRIFPMAAPLLALNGGSDTFTTESSGLADFRLTALHKFYDHEGARAHFGLGLSIPTGSITEEDIIPGPGGRIDRQLPAAMQLGSGTVDFLPSLTAVQQFARGSIGAQARGVIRTHDNDQGYRLGHRFEVDAWGALNLTQWLGVNAGIGYQWEGELSGIQDDVSRVPPFAPTRLTVPTAFGENYGGRRLDAIVGLNLLGPDLSNLSAHRLAIDARFPIYQDVNGYRLETDWTMTIGWQWAF